MFQGLEVPWQVKVQKTCYAERADSWKWNRCSLLNRCQEED